MVTVVATAKPSSYSPGEDYTAEIVDHGVQVDLGAIEKSDDGRVDVPELIGLGSAHPMLWLFGVAPGARPSPCPLANQPVPGRRRSEYVSESLGKDC